MQVADVNYRHFENQVSSNVQWAPSVRGSIPHGGASYSKIDFSPTLKKLTDLKGSIDKKAPPPVSSANVTMPPPITREGRYADAFVAAIKKSEQIKAYQSQGNNPGGIPPAMPTPAQAAPSLVAPTDRPTAMEGVYVGGVHHSVAEQIANEPRGANPEIAVNTNFYGSQGRKEKNKARGKPYDRPPPGAYPSPKSPTLAEEMAPYMDTYENRFARGVTGQADVLGKIVEYQHGSRAEKISPGKSITLHNILPIGSAATKEIPVITQSEATKEIHAPLVARAFQRGSKRKAEEAILFADQLHPRKQRLRHPETRGREVVLQPNVGTVERFNPSQAIATTRIDTRPVRHPKASMEIPRLAPTTRLPTVSEELNPLRRRLAEEVSPSESRPAKKQRMYVEEPEPIRRRPGNTYDPSVFGIPSDAAPHFRAGSNAAPLRELARVNVKYGIPQADYAGGHFVFEGVQEPTENIRKRQRGAGTMPQPPPRKKQRRE